MKKILFLFLISSSVYAQKNDSIKKHEIKFIFADQYEKFGSMVGVSYESMLDKKHTYGFETLYGTGYSKQDIKRNLSLTAFYRRYFSKNLNGFFTEGFLMYANYNSRNGIEEPDRLYLGFSLGVKFVIDNTITIGGNIGAGIDLIHIANKDFSFGVKNGISIGYRF